MLERAYNLLELFYDLIGGHGRKYISVRGLQSKNVEYFRVLFRPGNVSTNRKESTMTKNQQSKPQNEHGQQNQEPKKGQNPNDAQNRERNPKHTEHHDEKQHQGDKQPTR